jgi:hypothetical protein
MVGHGWRADGEAAQLLHAMIGRARGRVGEASTLASRVWPARWGGRAGLPRWLLVAGRAGWTPGRRDLGLGRDEAGVDALRGWPELGERSALGEILVAVSVSCARTNE